MSIQSITSLLKHNDYHITQIKFYPFRSVFHLLICSLLKCFIKFNKINIFTFILLFIDDQFEYVQLNVCTNFMDRPGSVPTYDETTKRQ